MSSVTTKVTFNSETLGKTYIFQRNEHKVFIVDQSWVVGLRA